MTSKTSMNQQKFSFIFEGGYTALGCLKLYKFAKNAIYCLIEAACFSHNLFVYVTLLRVFVHNFTAGKRNCQGKISDVVQMVNSIEVSHCRLIFQFVI